MTGSLPKLPYLFLLFVSFIAKAQPDRYILNGSAARNSCNCYTLTSEAKNQSGSVWNKIKIDLSEPFDFAFNVNLGCLDADGADGIVFILQPISTSIGTAGGGMGFSGVAPSVGIALDTWRNDNFGDPDYDHISIQANGAVSHTNDLAPPLPISATANNIEDCNWHVLRIVWDPATKWLQTFFDGVKRVEVQKDLIKDIFKDDPKVFWGFSAATGGAVNLQQFCTALNPNFSTDAPSDAVCIGNTISFKDQSKSFAPIESYYWDFGDGTNSLEANPSPHLYTSPGNYLVKQVITGKDGCISDTLKKTILIGSYPVADFNVFDTCYKASPRIVPQSTVEYGTINYWNWQLDGTGIGSVAQPALSVEPGFHQLSLIVGTNAGCMSTRSSKSFTIKELPVIQAKVMDGCLGNSLPFEGIQLDSKTTIQQWKWNFGDGSFSFDNKTEHVYSTAGIKNVTLAAQADNGCSSQTTQQVLVNRLLADAGKDSIVAKNSNFSLNGSAEQLGNKPLVFAWQPSSFLSNASDIRPSLSLENDESFILSVTSTEGCEVKDSVRITVFKGSAIYVPNAFTPNGDGRNELLKPLYIGIKKLIGFSVYNRWGQLVFTTNDLSKGWDGTFRGSSLPASTVVWFIKAEDFLGTLLELKGSCTLIK